MISPEQKVRNLLNSLGGTKEEVLRTLAEYGIENRYQGNRRCFTCPVALFLNGRLSAVPIHVEVTGEPSVFVYDGKTCRSWMALPTAVRDAVRELDHMFDLRVEVSL